MLAAAVLTTTVLMIGDARMRRAGTPETAPAAGQRLGPGHLASARAKGRQLGWRPRVQGSVRSGLAVTGDQPP
jgi:hypothetical protein